MEINSEIKIEAMDNAVRIYETIREACHTPTRMITGESLKVYEELEAWQFLEHYPILEEKHRWLYTTMIAAQQYKHLKWKIEHPPKPGHKKTKWEMVHGKMGKPTGKSTGR